jgi:hypothetical protein
MLVLASFCENAGLLGRFFEAAQGRLDGLSRLNSDFQNCNPPLGLP